MLICPFGVATPFCVILPFLCVDVPSLAVIRLSIVLSNMNQIHLGFPTTLQRRRSAYLSVTGIIFCLISIHWKVDDVRLLRDNENMTTASVPAG